MHKQCQRTHATLLHSSLVCSTRLLRAWHARVEQAEKSLASGCRDAAVVWPIAGGGGPTTHRSVMSGCVLCVCR
jgi:hypothetical protein